MIELGMKARRVEVVLVVDLCDIPKDIRCIGFCDISALLGRNKAKKLDSQLLYVLSDSLNHKNTQLTFFKFDARTEDLSEMENLRTVLPIVNPTVCVQNRDGGSWIITSGKNGVYVRFRVSPIGGSIFLVDDDLVKFD